jgi:hypothetical protein
MKIIYLFILALSIILFSCSVISVGEKIGKDKATRTLSNIEIEKSVLNFSKSVLEKKN